MLLASTRASSHAALLRFAQSMWHCANSICVICQYCGAIFYLQGVPRAYHVPPQVILLLPLEPTQFLHNSYAGVFGIFLCDAEGLFELYGC